MSPDTSPVGDPGAGLLSRLVDRQRGPAPAVRPVLPSRFEPVDQAALRLGEESEIGLDTRVEIAVHEPPPALPPARAVGRAESRRTTVTGEPALPEARVRVEAVPAPPPEEPHGERSPRRTAPPDEPRRTPSPADPATRAEEGPDAPARPRASRLLPSPLLPPTEPSTRARQLPFPSPADDVMREPGDAPRLPAPLVLAPQPGAEQATVARPPQPAPAAPAPRSQAPGAVVEQPITLSVRIGRVEVRHPAPAPEAAPERRTAPQPSLSLDDYLARPNRGRS